MRSDQVISRLEALVGQESIADEYVRLRIGLLQAQANTLDALRRSGPMRKAGGCGTSEHQASALALRALAIAPELAENLMIVLEHRLLNGGVGRAERVPPPGVAILIHQALIAREEADFAPLAQQVHAPAAVLAFVARLLAAPFVVHAAEQLSSLPIDPAGAATCPVCGSQPGLAVLRAAEDEGCADEACLAGSSGSRWLHCSLCAHAWLAPRLDCPFCAHEDAATIAQLRVEGLPARWIEGCSLCRHYLKTIDARLLPPEQEPIALVEEVAGLGLDLVAQREGYCAGLPYAAMA